jgi:hypothetical protein
MLAPPRPRSIRIQPGPIGDGFDVEILPPLDAGNFDKHFEDYRQARGYAAGLRMTLGLPLIDLCQEAEDG